MVSRRKLVCTAVVLFLVACVAGNSCSCDTLEQKLSNLRFSSDYLQFEEGVYYNFTELLPIDDQLLLLHYNPEVAGILDLNLDEFVDANSTCHQDLLRYLSGTVALPGSKPISIPLVER
jgi:hypothetical protein